jgi:hypothetical protein
MHLTPTRKIEWLRLPAVAFGCLLVAWIIWKFWSFNVSEEDNPFAPPPGLLPILNQAAFLAAILFNGLVLCYALNTRRHHKIRALTFWIWGCSINLIREIGLVLCNYWTPPMGNIESNFGRTDFWGLFYTFPLSSFMQFYWLGLLLAGALYVAGVILAIQQLRAGGRFSLSPNTAMFVALGFLVLMILMGVSFMRLDHAEILPALAVNLTVLCVCVAGYRQVKFKVAVFLILAAVLTVARNMVVYWQDRQHNLIHYGTIYTVEQWLMGLVLLGSIAATVFWGAGMVLIIRRFADREPSQTGT